MTDPFVLRCDGLPPGARVLAFDGVEEISTMFRYEVDLLVDPDAKLDDAVGADATLEIHPDGHAATTVHGVVASATVLEHMESADLHRVVLVPRIRAVLGLDRHSRVFVGEAVPAIIQTLLHAAGFSHEDCEFRLWRTYGPIDFVCQYRESTLDFLMRWMERDGIYFFFAHDGTRERLVLADDRGQHSRAEVRAPYQASIGLAESDGLHRFCAERHAVPGVVYVEDYDYQRPALQVRAQARVEGGTKSELRERCAKVVTPKDAQRIALLRAEGLRARQTVYRGAGRLHGIHAGAVMTVEGHPRPSLDADYLITKLRVRGHAAGDLGATLGALLGRSGERDEVLSTELEAIRADVQFRPELRTATPRVYGMESGIVDGDVESNYAQIDDYGRYLVKFQFDEGSGRGSAASARIRMMQPHAGSPEGMHFPLRKGTEVLVSFVGGDPDRPVIAGAVPNAMNPAVVHGANSTKNMIQSGGGNRIVMEDAEGQQYVHISSPHLGTYIHLGSPFNPQYNKVTNTSGTSLTYTQDISMSVTGTDSQTIVEDSRMTIIGRSRVAPPGGITSNQTALGNAGATAAAAEITALLGPDFIGEFEASTDVLTEQIAADAEKLIKDASQLNTVLGTSGNPPAPPGKPSTTPPSATGVETAANVLITDLQTLAGDAQNYGKAVAAGTIKPPTGFDLAQWEQNIQTALTAVQDLLATVLVGPVGTPLSDPFSAGATTVTVASAAGTSGPITVPSKTATAPFAPSPDATPTYILLDHGTHTTTLSATQAAAPTPSATVSPELVDDYIQKDLAKQPEANDGTAMDVFDTTAYAPATNPFAPGTVPPLIVPPPPAPFPKVGQPYALSPGSDIKVVGGDNVTLAARDARSHTEGHAYTLVHGGQTSVVYSYDAYGGAWSSSNMQSDPPPVAPVRPTAIAWDPEEIAQVATAYGNVRSWVDGSTDATIVDDVTTTVGGDKKATIGGDSRATIGGTVYTDIKHDQHTTIGDPGLAVDVLSAIGVLSASPVAEALVVLAPLVAGSNVTTSIWGNRLTTILGTDTALTVGLKTNAVVGLATSLWVGAGMSIHLGLKVDMEQGGSVKIGEMVNVKQDMVKVANAIAHTVQTVVHAAEHEVSVVTSGIHTLLSELTSFL